MLGDSAQVIKAILLAIAVAFALTACTSDDSQVQAETQDSEAAVTLADDVAESARPPLCDPAVADRQRDLRDRAVEAAVGNPSLSASMLETLLMETYDHARSSGLDNYADAIYSHIQDRDRADVIQWRDAAFDLAREALVICIDWMEEESEGEREAWLAEREGENAGGPEQLDEHDWDNEGAYRVAFTQAINEANRIRAEAHDVGVSSGMQAVADVMEGQLPELRELGQPFWERTAPRSWAAANDELAYGLSVLEQSWLESIDSIRADDVAGQASAALTLRRALAAFQEAIDAAPFDEVTG